MTTNCFEREQLFAYASKMLEAREEIEVRAHVAGCAACRKVVEGYCQLDRVLDLWQPAEPSPWFDARVRAAVAATAERVSGLWDRVLAGWGWGRWLAPALVAMMVVVVSVIVKRPGPLSRSVEPAAAIAHQGPAKSLAPQVGAQGKEEERTAGEEYPATADDYDLLANFDLLSELPKPEAKVVD